MDWLPYVVSLSALTVLYLTFSFTAKTPDIRRLYAGADGRPSTSKFQALLWFVAIFASYIAILVARIAHHASPEVAPALDQSLVLALAASGATAVLAKQVTTTNVNAGRLVKPKTGAGKSTAPGGIFTADNGDPDLGKIQLVGWTFVAVALFLWTVGQHLAQGGSAIALPGVDPTLLGLTGVGQAAYLGHKLVAVSGPSTGFFGPSAGVGAPQSDHDRSVPLTAPPSTIASPSGNAAITENIPAQTYEMP